jgi:hypothetical protein
VAIELRPFGADDLEAQLEPCITKDRGAAASSATKADSAAARASDDGHTRNSVFVRCNGCISATTTCLYIPAVVGL